MVSKCWEVAVKMAKSIKDYYPGQSPGDEELKAVIVGIDGYKDLRALNCAVNDAVSLSGTLKKAWERYDIRTLVWPEKEKFRHKEKTWGVQVPDNAADVTRESILEHIRLSAGSCKESDTFLFYFSGHGVLLGDEPVLITVENGETAEGVDYINISEIQQAAVHCNSKRKVMILDCCQNIDDRTETQPRHNTLRDLCDGWWILLSCSPGELSLEDRYAEELSDDYLQQGIFTASLVAGLRGEANGGNGGITLTQLAAYVGKRVPVEYQERVMEMILSKGEKSPAPGESPMTQNPVLIGECYAVGGPYQVVMAPRRVPLSHEARVKWPSISFPGNWFRFVFGRWPVMFPHKHAFREGGAVLYGLVMLLTVIWQSNVAEPTQPVLLFWVMTGAGSAFIWWIMLPFAVAVNEERWHVGGYLVPFFYVVWHAVVAMWFYNLFGKEVRMIVGGMKINHLIFDLIVLLGPILICNCNASHAVIALAEPLRPEDERGEIRQVIRALEEFKNKSIGVSLYNFIPMVSARPVAYYWVFGAALLLVIVQSILVIAGMDKPEAIYGLFLLKSMLIIVWIAMLVIWYASAFKNLQKEVYKR